LGIAASVGKNREKKITKQVLTAAGLPVFKATAYRKPVKTRPPEAADDHEEH
jgi:hypothetical protein